MVNVISDFGSPNYQRRIIYYNEIDNVCAYQELDEIFLTITFSDRRQIEATVDGGTRCDPWKIMYVNKLRPKMYMSYLSCHENLCS